MKRRVLTCPQCGSLRVHITAGSVAGQVYRCNACGYMGSLILEKEVEVGEEEVGED